MSRLSRFVVPSLILGLAAIVAAVQLRLWTGPSSLIEVDRLARRIDAQRADNEALRRRNAALAADVQDLKSGHEAIEERARSELGMTRPGEVFYQVIDPVGRAPEE